MFLEHPAHRELTRGREFDRCIGQGRPFRYDDEVAFYDALETNDSAVKVLGDEALRMIARELVATVRANVTIDWTVRENVRAHLRVLVKRILRKYGYPPDMQEKATKLVLEQAEVLSPNRRQLGPHPYFFTCSSHINPPQVGIIGL